MIRRSALQIAQSTGQEGCTTRPASAGCLPQATALRPLRARRPTFLAAVSDSTSSMSTNTRQFSSSTSSVILANSLDTSLPLSLNHLLNRLCALTSTSCPCEYLRASGGQLSGEGKQARA